MKILTVTNMYPSEARPNYGVFVKEQMEAVTRRCPDVEYDLYYIDNTHGNKAYLNSVFRINRQISRGDYDIIHIHYGLSGLFMLWPLRRWNVPVVLTLHGGDIQPEQGKTVQVPLTRMILGRVDAAISLNDRMQALASEKCRNVVKIACSVDTDIFCPAAEGGRRPADRYRKIRILFPSDPARTVKNYPLFQAVVAELRAKYGLDAETANIMDMDRSQVAEAMRNADVLLMTSISEGSPQVVKEAMACNLPVVSTKVGDVDMLLEGVCRSAWSETADCGRLADLVYVSAVKGFPAGMDGREKIFRLGLDSASVAMRIYNLYLSLIKKP